MLILILIDGLSADYFAAHRTRLPHLEALAGEGLEVARLAPTVPGTSMPGRASILTGVGAETHGVFGNHILDEGTFRCVHPEDLRVPSLQARARRAGRTVASIGFGLVRPDDTDLYVAPWWMRSWVSGSRFAKMSSRIDWLDVQAVRDPAGRLAAIDGVTLPYRPGPDEAPFDLTRDLILGMASDRAIAGWVAGLACGDAPPDLIATEIDMPDYVQHCWGYESDAAHWALSTADLLVGSLRAQLQQAGRRDETVIAVTSDHGHAPIRRAAHPDRLLPDAVWEAEGCILNVLLDGGWTEARVSEALAGIGAVPLGDDHLPPDIRGRLASFAAPEGASFEPAPRGSAGTEPFGPPMMVSSHGLPPGSPADDRICILAGPGVPRRRLAAAPAERLAPTLAHLLGLPPAATDGPTLFDPP